MAELSDTTRAEGTTDISKGAQVEKTLLGSKQKLPTKVRCTIDNDIMILYLWVHFSLTILFLFYRKNVIGYWKL